MWGYGSGGEVRKNFLMNWCHWHKLVSLKKHTLSSIPHSQSLEQWHFCRDEAWLASRPWFPVIIRRKQGSSKKSSKVGQKVPSEAESLEVLKVRWGPIKDAWAGEGAPTGPAWDNLSINKLNGILVFSNTLNRKVNFMKLKWFFFNGVWWKHFLREWQSTNGEDKRESTLPVIKGKMFL